jgi:hypothetical protein
MNNVIAFRNRKINVRKRIRKLTKIYSNSRLIPRRKSKD